MNNRKLTRGRKSWRLTVDAVARLRNNTSRRNMRHRINAEDALKLREQYWAQRERYRQPGRFIDRRLRKLEKVMPAAQEVRATARKELIKIKERMLRFKIIP